MTIIDRTPNSLDAQEVACPPTPSTVLPGIHATPRQPVELRTLSGISREDALTFGGAFVSALCTTILLFGRLTPLSGPLGFFVVFFVVLNATYGLMVSFSDDRAAVVDRVMAVMMSSCAVLAGGALISVVVYILIEGRDALGNPNLFVEDMSEAGPLEPLSVGGISHAIVGSLLIIGLSVLITVPLGISCAVFLNETRSRLARPVRTVVDAMTALPSIVAGLFIFATFILLLGFERSGLAASLAVSIMMLPIIIRSGDVVLRLVPGNLREASAALGAPLWRTVAFVVLPTARSGLATAVILGVARGVGETAPVLLTSGVTGSMNVNMTEAPMMSLPLATFEFVRSPQPEQIARGFATAAVLMVLVLVLFSLARILGGRGAGHLSSRQQRKTAARSQKDVARYESNTRGTAA
jgi:phosphate transport system permease protein